MLASLLHRLGFGFLIAPVAAQSIAPIAEPIRTTSGLPRATVASMRRETDRSGSLLNLDTFR